MKKKFFYFLLSISLLILVFTTALTCNLCGSTLGQESSTSEITGKTGTDEESATQNSVSATTSQATSSTQAQESTSSTQSDSATSSTSGSKSAPTITLSVYEGPTYSPADGVCYYRIEAIVTGNPAPTVTFSKDDSGGAWGSKKTQINLNPGDTYTLVATATNSEGVATASMNITYGCSEGVNREPVVSDISISNPNPVTNTEYDISVTASDPDSDTLTFNWSAPGIITNGTSNPAKWKTSMDAGTYTVSVSVSDGKGHTVSRTKSVVVSAPPIISADLNKVASEGGYVEKDGGINAGGCLYAGDSGSNKQVFGFISFDISSLSGRTIQSANAVFSLSQQWGNPIDVFDQLALNELYWGPRAIQNSDAFSSGNFLQLSGTSTFSCSNAALKTALQNAINAGRPRFQLRIHFTGPMTGNPGAWDGWEYQQSNVKLSITYN